MIKKLFEYKSDNKYHIYIFFGIKITIKKNIYKQFINRKIPEKTVLIVEFNNYHGETLPGFIKYFEDLNYNIDILINFNLYNDKVLDSFNFKNIKNIFNYDQDQIINNILLFPIIKNYEIVFYNTFLFIKNNEKVSIFVEKPKIMKNMKQYVCIEHNSFYNYKINADKNKVATLLPNKLYSRYINPHYFGNQKINNKNTITNLSLFAREKTSLKNIILLINCIKKIIDEGISNFELTLIGKVNELNIDISGYENNIKFTGYLDYQSLYKRVEKSDFILPMLDPDIEDHKRFMIDVSGTFQLIYGFYKVPIIHNSFSKRYGFNEENALIYNNDAELIKNIKYAISMSNDEYKEKSKIIYKYANLLYKESLENLKYMLENKNQ